MVFIFRMPPCSKPYPITRGLAQYFPPASSKNKSLPFDEATTLAAVYQKQPVGGDLKKVVRYLKEPLELFPKIILRAEFSVTIEVEGVSTQLHWELTVKEARRSLHCVLDALGLLHQGLFHSKILLKHVEQILYEDERNGVDCDSKKFSEEEVQKLTKLKENLLKLNKFLDCVLLQYSSFSCQLPPALIKNVKNAAKKVYQVINQLKPDRLNNLIPYSTVTEEDVLCSVLGLSDDFANRLKDLSEEMRQHKTDMYFLLYFLKDRYDCLNVESLHDTDEVARLQKMGFTENRSSVIARWIDEQPFPRHKSLLAWAQIYIENLFKYDIFLNDHVSRFPYQERCLNQWFGVDADCGESEDGCVSQVSVINTTTQKDACHIADKTKAEFEGKNKKRNFYFHGTDHKSAQNILENGINLRDGQTGCDFSHGCGFYVADKFECALEYASKSKAAAVVLFNLSDDCLKKGIDLSDPERHKDLQSVSEYFRSGEPRKHRLDKKLYEDINNCNYIIGPISMDGISKSKRRQICIKDEEMADEIGSPSNIVGIVFLNDAQ
jgi:hypothetical protein